MFLFRILKNESTTMQFFCCKLLFCLFPELPSSCWCSRLPRPTWWCAWLPCPTRWSCRLPCWLVYNNHVSLYCIVKCAFMSLTIGISWQSKGCVIIKNGYSCYSMYLETSWFIHHMILICKCTILLRIRSV